MNPRDERLWLSLQRRAGVVTPELQAELLHAFRIIREALTDAELEELITSGQIDAILDDALLDRSLLDFRAKVIETVQRGFRATIPELPRAGKVDGELAIGFDQLNPKVIDAIRELDSRVINTIKEDVREVVRAQVENGLRDGDAHRTIARRIRPLVGLAPNQAEAVRNYERALRGENPNAGPTDYKLRDRRYDKLEMTPERIDKAVTAYRRKMEAHHANTVSRNASVDSLKLGQRLTWDDAIERQIVARDQLERTWIAVAGPGGDGRNRPEHLAMHGETVPFDASYSNGDTVPGESDFGCRCTERITVRRVPKSQAA